MAAVSLDGQGQPMYLKLNLVGGFTALALGRSAKANLRPGTVVTSDGLGYFAPVADAGCSHNPMIVVELKRRHLPRFKWVNMVLNSLKTLAGMFHSLKFFKYADYYLADLACRFNRRFDLRALVALLIVDLARCKPFTRAAVRTTSEARF